MKRPTLPISEYGPDVELVPEELIVQVKRAMNESSDVIAEEWPRFKSERIEDGEALVLARRRPDGKFYSEFLQVTGVNNDGLWWDRIPINGERPKAGLIRWQELRHARVCRFLIAD